MAGLPVPTKAATASFVVSDLNGTIATLTAQLAAEKAGRALDAQSASNLLATEKAGRAADKVAADKALADAVAAKTASDAKASADAVTAKAAADVATAAAAAKYKAEYNALATKWNKKNPKAKVALKK